MHFTIVCNAIKKANVRSTFREALAFPDKLKDLYMLFQPCTCIGYSITIWGYAADKYVRFKVL